MNVAQREYQEAEIVFSEDFLFGVGTAAYQIEGAADEDGRGPSIWDTFSHTPGRTKDGGNGDTAVDHYHRLEDDLDLLASLGIPAYRFSISWSRIQPDGEGAINQPGLDFYSRLVDGLLVRGIEPVATLFHWDLPQALEDAYGGWLGRATPEAFERYAEIVGAALGDRVARWTTLNEPLSITFLGYGLGIHAPGHTDYGEAIRVAHHLNLAHGLAVGALRRTVTHPDLSVSIVLNPAQIEPVGEGGSEAVRLIDAIANRIFTGPILHGEYPEDLLSDTATFTDWGFVREGDLEVINAPIDALGINYYTAAHIRVRTTEDGPAPARGLYPNHERVIDVVDERAPRTTYGWTIEPDGLERLLISLSKQFPGVPLMITENGAAFPDTVTSTEGRGMIIDDDRIEYLRSHLIATHRAIQHGANVCAYFVWTLFDNFEWSEGYTQKFGLVHVDRDTLERRQKKSAAWYGSVARTRVLPTTIGSEQ